jgi:hypothetical protein
MIKSVDICIKSGKQYVSVEVNKGKKVEYLNFTEKELHDAIKLAGGGELQEKLGKVLDKPN